MCLQSALLDSKVVSGGRRDLAACILLWLIIEESFHSEFATICSYYIKIVHLATKVGSVRGIWQLEFLDSWKSSTPSPAR